LREDRRHIKDKDLYILKEVVKTKLNLEMSLAPDIVEIASSLKPAQATLVPENRQEVTTEGGLDVIANFKKVKQVAARLEKNGISVSLFIDPEKDQISAAKKIGVGIVELHTGRYAGARNQKEEDKYFRELLYATGYAQDQGLVVNAGHGLDYYNVERVAKIKEIEELNIGYAIICRAVIVGLERAVHQMRALVA
jgi:pyridoxine 5-phosphate synthase